MYEWVQTANGWRIFWGVDPLTGKAEAKKDDRDTATELEHGLPSLLGHEHEDDQPAPPAA